MVKSKITGKEYVERDAIYIANMLQAQRYLAYLGPEYLLDILYTGIQKFNVCVPSPNSWFGEIKGTKVI